jgi:hypothetical protein
MKKTTALTFSIFLLLLGSTVYFVGCNRRSEVASSADVTATNIVVCPNCSGTGRHDFCRACAERDASGRLTCEACSGTGTLLCGFCNGRGTVPQEAVPRIETQMEIRRIGIEAEEKRLAQLEKERHERAMLVAQLEAEIEKEKIKAEQERFVAEQEERERQEQARQKIELEKLP